MEFITTGMFGGTGSEGSHCFLAGTVFNMQDGMGAWRNVKTLYMPLTFLCADSNDFNRGQRCWAGLKASFWPLGTILLGFILRARVK